MDVRIPLYPPSRCLLLIVTMDDEDVVIALELPSQQRNHNFDIMCCECQWYEAGSYIMGTVFGLTGSILTTQPGYNHSHDIDLSFKVFVGLFILLYLVGLICTCRRYYKICINRRGVDDM